MSNSEKLIFCFAPGKENMIISRDNIILESFKNSTSITNKDIKDYLISKQVKSSQLNTIKDYLKSNYIKFGNQYFKEILFKTNLTPTDTLTPEISERIDKEFDSLLNEFRNPVYILYSGEKESLISLIELKYYNNKNYFKTHFNNINDLVIEYYYKKDKLKFVTDTKEKKLSELNQKLKKIEKNICNLNIHLKESLDSEKYLNYGNYILANLGDIKQNMDYLEILEEDSIEKIKLDNTISPSKNAQKYFKKYKKQKESADLLKLKIGKFEKEKIKVQEEINNLKNMSDFKEIKNISKSNIKEKDNDETSKFRKFVLSDDYQVWVGKDSKSNDLLTMHYSAPNDLWFHIRGTSGSHTVLKTGNKTENLDKNIIETAASICAYYSKARNAGNVPVAFCQRKYVKKKKGFKEGSVVMEREKVVFVKPKLPEGFESD
jgi:predicted ribosome quality control (RQC) complex YloA/Tae2 family protein